MAQTIKVSHVEQYKRNVDTLLRQHGSRFRGAVVVDDKVTGKRKYTEQIGAGVAKKRTSRHADTPLTQAEHKRRAVDLFDYEYADLVDQQDRVRILIEPRSAYVEAASDAMGHAMDDEVITAATGDAKTGEDGSTVISLPSTQKVAVDFVKSGVAKDSGLTVTKLRRAKKILMANEAARKGEKLYFAASAAQIEDLLGDDEVTSNDYNAVKALVDGDVDHFMGFTFIRSERLAIASSVRTCFAWARTGIELDIAMDKVIRVSERDDKSYAMQVYAMMTIGATRLQEEKVVQVSCKE